MFRQKEKANSVCTFLMAINAQPIVQCKLGLYLYTNGFGVAEREQRGVLILSGVSPLAISTAVTFAWQCPPGDLSPCLPRW